MLGRSRLLTLALALALPTALVPGPAGAEFTDLRHQIVCASETADGQIQYTFEVTNPDAVTHLMPFGTNNMFSTAPYFRGQPTAYPPGVTTFTTPPQGRDVPYAEWIFVDGPARGTWSETPRCLATETVTAQPQLAGTLAPGEQVAVSGGVYRLNNALYDVATRWFVDCDTAEPVEVGSGLRYTVQPADEGRRLQAVVTYSHPLRPTLEGRTACDAAATVGSAPTLTSQPTVVGAAVVGSDLGLVGGSWSGPGTISSSVSWESCAGGSCAAVGTGATYRAATADIGHTLRAVQTATSAFGSAQVTTVATAPVLAAPAATGGVGVVPSGSLAFPPQAAGSRSEPATYTYTNSTSAAVQIRSVVITGEHSREFVVSSRTCVTNLVLAPGAACTVQVRFAPLTDAPGERRATLYVRDGVRRDVALTGSALPGAEIGLDRTAVDLGSTPVGVRSQPRSFTITNPGTVPLTVTQVVRGGPDLRVVGVTGWCITGGVILPGESCVVSVTFRPTRLGAHAASLLVRSDADGGTRFVDVSGTAG